MKKMPRVVTIGGGTGSYTSLMGLKKHPLKLTAIVNMIDDGGSSGRLRDELGVLPPGDIRQCLVALSDSTSTLRKLFNYRFEEGGLKGHTFGNIFLSTLEKQTGSIKLAINSAGRILNIKGRVVPVTFTKKAKLCVDLTDGRTIIGETHIDEVEEKDIRAPIKKVYLNPKATLNPDVKKVLDDADYILIGPGDLYTSIIPNILVSKMPEAIAKSKAKKIFVMNLMTKYGQTTKYNANKHFDELEKYLGKNIIDMILINTGKPKESVLMWYENYGEHPVKNNMKNDKRVIEVDLLRDVVVKKNSADKLRRSIIRHDSDRLADAVMKIIESN